MIDTACSSATFVCINQT